MSDPTGMMRFDPVTGEGVGVPAAAVSTQGKRPCMERFCPLNETEKEQKRQVREMREEYGSNPTICYMVICRNVDEMGMTIGKHELAWCHKVGGLRCYLAHKAFGMVERVRVMILGDIPGDPKDGVENAIEHAVLMIALRSVGISEENARLLGIAHEVDAANYPGKKRSTGLGSYDSRIDMANNEAGLAIAENVIHRTITGTHYSDEEIAAAILEAMSSECRGATCLDTRDRP